jgi:hypothetical protein
VPPMLLAHLSLTGRCQTVLSPCVTRCRPRKRFCLMTLPGRDARGRGNRQISAPPGRSSRKDLSAALTNFDRCYRYTNIRLWSISGAGVCCLATQRSQLGDPNRGPISRGKSPAFRSRHVTVAGVVRLPLSPGSDELDRGRLATSATNEPKPEVWRLPLRDGACVFPLTPP